MIQRSRLGSTQQGAGCNWAEMTQRNRGGYCSGTSCLMWAGVDETLVLDHREQVTRGWITMFRGTAAQSRFLQPPTLQPTHTGAVKNSQSITTRDTWPNRRVGGIITAYLLVIIKRVCLFLYIFLWIKQKPIVTWDIGHWLEPSL